MEKVDLIERKVLLQNNEKVSARKHTTSVNIQENAYKHIRSCTKKLAYSTAQS